MKRLLDNLYIDLIAASLMIGMAATGYILRFPLPPGSNKSLTLWTLTRHQWGDVHFWISLALLGVILLHIVLHWQWVVVTVRRKVSAAKAAPGSAWLGGLLTSLALVAGMALFAWAAHHGVEQITEPREGVCPNPTESETKEMTAEPDSAPAPLRQVARSASGRTCTRFWIGPASPATGRRNSEAASEPTGERTSLVRVEGRHSSFPAKAQRVR